MPNQEFIPKSHEKKAPTFTDKFKELLPGVEFEEPADLSEARIAVLEALSIDDQEPDLLRRVWTEYSNISEQFVDGQANAHPKSRALLQIITLVYKALIFREVKDTQRYNENLSDAAEYAYNMHFDEIAEAIDTELEEFTK